MAEIYKADGRIEELKDVSWNSLKKAIGGGMIETLFIYDKGQMMILDEEGKLKNLSINENASMFYSGGNIVGDVVILDEEETLKFYEEG